MANPGRLWMVLVPWLALGLAGCLSQDEDARLADIHGMALDPDDPSDLYVATHHGLFVIEVPDGNPRGVTADPFDMMGFSMHPDDASVMWASGHPAGGGNVGVRKSVDGGATWSTLSLQGQVDFHAMAISPADPDRLWGYHAAKVWRSDDGGRTWDSWADPTLEQVLAFAGHASDPETVYAATNRGIHRSGDAGETWTRIHGDSGMASAIATTRADSELLVAYFPGIGLQRSEDDGIQWAPMGLKINGNDVGAAVALHPTDPAAAYLGTYGGAIHGTTAGGATWNKVA